MKTFSYMYISYVDVEFVCCYLFRVYEQINIDYESPVYTYIFVKCISKTTSGVWFYGIAILSQLHAVCSGH